MALSLTMWLHVLYQYEMTCYDMGHIAIDNHHRDLRDYFDTFG